MSGKSTLQSRKNSPFGQWPISRRDPSSRTTYCRVIIYHYFKQNFGIASHVQGRGNFSQSQLNAPGLKSETQRVVIESDLASVNITKSIDQPSANFDIGIHPTKNWKRFIGPGDWILIYFYNSIDSIPSDISEKSPDFTNNLVLCGNVDRISRSVEKEEESDKIKVRYKVAGRNFGKVLEDNDIWFDPYQNQEKTLDSTLREAGLPLEGAPSKIVTNLLNTFLGEGGKFIGGETTPLKQWSIPSPLATAFKGDIGGRGKPFFNDILQREIGDLPGNKNKSHLGVDSNGSLWDVLKRDSNGLINEIFLEEVRSEKLVGKKLVTFVKPTIVMRPRPHNTPFFDSQFGKGADLQTKKFLRGNFKTMQDLAKESFLEISRGEILFEDIGRDDHSRMNMFILGSSLFKDIKRQRMGNVNKGKGVANPMVLRESVERYGLKRFDQLLDWTYPSDQKPQASETDLFKAFMAQLYDMHYANHLYEAGTIECSGVLEAELGKALKILPNSGSGGLPKIYYIEGYEHRWSFPSTWRTTFTVTKGQFQTTGDKIFIDLPATDFGQNDEIFDQTFLTKTNVRNKR